MDKRSAPIKGLLFRELYLGRNTFVSVLLVGIFGGIAVTLIVLSAMYGNLAAETSPEEIPDMASMALTIVSGTFTLMAGLSSETAIHDLSNKWLWFLYSSPVNEKKFIGVKFVIMIALVLIAVILTTIVGVIISAVTGIAYTASTLSGVVCVMSLVVVIDVIFMVLTYFFKSMNTALIWFGIGLVPLGVGIIFAALSLCGGNIRKLEEGLGQLITISAPFAPIVAAVALVIGYFACVKLLQRREK